MDKKVIEVSVGGQSILVETTSPDVKSDGPRTFSTGASPTHKVASSVEDSLGVLQDLGRALKASLKDIGAKEAEAELAVKFTASGKLMIVEGSAEASLSIKLKF